METAGQAALHHHQGQLDVTVSLGLGLLALGADVAGDLVVEGFFFRGKVVTNGFRMSLPEEGVLSQSTISPFRRRRKKRFRAPEIGFSPSKSSFRRSVLTAVA